MMETAETTMPWIIYRFGRTHDLWWPFWNSTRVLGRSCIICECAVCGDVTPLWMKIPRFGDVTVPGGGSKHPKREAYLKAHAHFDRGHPMSWARPLRNMNVFGSTGLDLDLLAARMEADINERAMKPTEPKDSTRQFTMSDWVTCEYEEIDPDYSGATPHPWRPTCLNPKLVPDA